MNVYKAINAVQRELAKVGITKNRKNIQQNYSFRGIDEVFNTLSPLLAEHELCILPRMISRTCEERTTKNGGSMNYVTVEAEFDFVSSMDGSRHVVRTFGEAMDSADKATNKAMSAAYKYAAFQAFAIPTEGDNDADAHTPQPAPKQHPPRPSSQPATQQQAAPKPLITDSQRKHLMAIYGSAPRADRLADANEILRKASPSWKDVQSFAELTASAADYLIKQLEAMRQGAA